MAIVSNNVLIEPVTSFTVDDNDCGAIDGGVRVRQEVSWFDAFVDQSVGVQKKALTEKRIFLEANLAEGKLLNLQLAASMPDANIAGAVLTYDADELGEIAVGFVTTNPAGFARTYAFARCVVIGNSETPYLKDGVSIVPITIEVLPSVDGGDSWGTVTDAAA